VRRGDPEGRNPFRSVDREGVWMRGRGGGKDIHLYILVSNHSLGMENVGDGKHTSI